MYLYIKFKNILKIVNCKPNILLQIYLSDAQIYKYKYRNIVP